MPNTEWLTDWERAVVLEAVSRALKDGIIHAEHGESLLAKLEAASHIRVSTPFLAPARKKR